MEQQHQIRWTDLETGATGLVLRDGKEPLRGSLDFVTQWVERFNANSTFHRCAVEPVPSESL